jgi:hypothetical protein
MIPGSYGRATAAPAYRCVHKSTILITSKFNFEFGGESGAFSFCPRPGFQKLLGPPRESRMLNY